MPLVLLGILIALPVLDIYATLRVAEALNVPGILLFIPGVIFGIVVMKRETRTLRAQFVGALQTMAVQGMVFDSGRRRPASPPRLRQRPARSIPATGSESRNAAGGCGCCANGFEDGGWGI